jgi:hypothetical protein
MTKKRKNADETVLLSQMRQLLAQRRQPNWAKFEIIQEDIDQARGLGFTGEDLFWFVCGLACRRRELN